MSILNRSSVLLLAGLVLLIASHGDRAHAQSADELAGAKAEALRRLTFVLPTPELAYAGSDAERAYDGCQKYWSRFDSAHKASFAAFVSGTNDTQGECFLAWGTATPQIAVDNALATCKNGGWPRCFVFASAAGLSDWAREQADRITSHARRNQYDASINAAFKALPNNAQGLPGLRAKLYRSCATYFNFVNHQAGETPWQSAQNFKAMVASPGPSSDDYGPGPCIRVFGMRSQGEADDRAMAQCRARTTDCYLFARGVRPEPWVYEFVDQIVAEERKPPQRAATDAEVAARVRELSQQDSGSGFSVGGLLQAGAAVAQGVAAGAGGNAGPVGGLHGPNVTSCPAGYYRGSLGYGNGWTCMPYGRGPSTYQQHQDSGISGGR